MQIGRGIHAQATGERMVFRREGKATGCRILEDPPEWVETGVRGKTTSFSVIGGGAEEDEMEVGGGRWRGEGISHSVITSLVRRCEEHT